MKTSTFLLLRYPLSGKGGGSGREGRRGPWKEVQQTTGYVTKQSNENHSPLRGTAKHRAMWVGVQIQSATCLYK